eukprot:3311741-Rhodomonas_salina.2
MVPGDEYQRYTVLLAQTQYTCSSTPSHNRTNCPGLLVRATLVYSYKAHWFTRTNYTSFLVQTTLVYSLPCPLSQTAGTATRRSRTRGTTTGIAP